MTCLICCKYFKCWCIKIHAGGEALFEKGVVCCVLVVRVQFDAMDVFHKW